MFRCPPCVTIRPAVAADADGLLAMAARCTQETLYYRFFGPTRLLPPQFLTTILAPSRDRIALVAVDRSGAVIALADWTRTAPDAGELGLLVEDQWQARGVGRRLLVALVATAATRGATIVHGVVLSERVAIVRGVMTRAGLHTSARLDGPTTELTATVTPASSHVPEAAFPSPGDRKPASGRDGEARHRRRHGRDRTPALQSGG